MNKRLLYLVCILSNALLADSFPLGFTNIQLNPENCAERNSGSIVVSAQSDHPNNIVYTLNPQGPSPIVIVGPGPVTFDGLAAGTYVIRIQDNLASEPIRDASVQLGFAVPLFIERVDVTNVAVAGGDTGQIVMLVRGGFQTITVVVNDTEIGTFPIPPTGLTEITIPHLAKGVYKIELTSNDGCGTIVLELPIRQPAEG